MTSFTGYRTEIIPVTDWQTCHENLLRNLTSNNSTWCGNEDKMNETIEANLADFNAKHSDTDFNFICGPQVVINGDSGGPLMRTDKYGFWNLIAIVRGHHESQTFGNPCDNSTAKAISQDDYQIIVPFLHWIYEAIEN